MATLTVKRAKTRLIRISHFTDIDECDPANPVHDCDLGSTDCINMVGSFRCDCHPGYTKLNSTTNSCEGNHGYRKEITFQNMSVCVCVRVYFCNFIEKM